MDDKEAVKPGERLRDLLLCRFARFPRGLWATLLFAWIAALSVLALSRGPRLPHSAWLSFFWNFAHAPFYGLLAPLTLCALPRQSGQIDPSSKNLQVAWGVTMLVGIAHELLQGSTGYRSFSLWDWASDGAGALALLGFFWISRHHAPSRTALGVWSLFSLFLCALPAWFETFGLSL